MDEIDEDMVCTAIKTTAFNNDYKQRSFMGITDLVQGVANVGFTILVFCIGLVIVSKFKGDSND